MLFIAKAPRAIFWGSLGFPMVAADGSLGGNAEGSLGGNADGSLLWNAEGSLLWNAEGSNQPSHLQSGC